MNKKTSYTILLIFTVHFAISQNRDNVFIWPKSPASVVFQDFIKAYNSKDEDEVRNFVKMHYSLNKTEDIDRKVELWMDLYYRYGSITPHYLSINKEHDLEIWVKGDITKNWFAPEFILNEETNKIKAVGLLEGEQPDKVVNFPVNETQFISNIENYLEENEKAGLFQGSILIKKDEKPILNKAYGYSNIDSEVKNQVDTRMRISSITKPITIVACLQLVQNGVLDLETPISEYLKELPSHIANKLTLKSMISHTSSYELDNIDGFREALEKTKSMEEVYQLHLDYLPKWENYKNFQPSGKFDYSNDSFDLIAIIIEKVTGIKFENYLNEYVFKIANMKNSSYENNNLSTPYRYDLKQKGLANYDSKYPFSLGKISGAGGLKSTTEDLSNFFSTLYKTNKLLDLPYKSLMFSIFQLNGTASNPDIGDSLIKNIKTIENAKVNNGRSFGFSISYDTNLNIGHNGTSIGNSAELRYFPNSDYLMIVLCNNRSGAQNFYNFFKNNLPRKL
jgi:CubicO group peptidase (beta-lactamase class C family)